ncbi:MAG: cyclic peptide export ABC transporter [Verrucomicrobiota bacterium]
MEFLKYLRRESEDFNANLILVGVFAGVVNLILIIVLTLAASKAATTRPDGTSLALTALCIAAFWFSKKYLLTRATIIVEEIIGKVRRRIVSKIRETDLASFENTGPEAFINAVSIHANTLSQASIHVIHNSHAVVMVLLAFGFIYYLSQPGFWIVTSVLGVLVWAFFRNRTPLNKALRKIAHTENEFMRGFADLTDGFKELKMDTKRDREFIEDFLHGLIERCMDLKKRTSHMINHNLLIAHSALFFLLSAVVFILPSFGEQEAASVVPVAAVVIFIFAPVSDLVGAIPFLAHAGASVEELERIENVLNAIRKEDASVMNGNDGLVEEEFSKLEMKQIKFHYQDKSTDETFTLGPVDFELNKGELVFMIGGNGSGKSTFLKLLTGLYQPDSGVIEVNGRRLGNKQIRGYRNLMSPIFSDFHLFNQLFGINPVESEKAERYIEWLELTGKTKIKNKSIANLSLSAGQRKRVALLVSLFEDKPILVFDEWAAEQDPEFRKKFYLEIIPEFRRAGKTIFAITHDEHFFHTADRIVKMDYGQISEISSGKAKRPMG